MRFPGIAIAAICALVFVPETHGQAPTAQPRYVVLMQDTAAGRCQNCGILAQPLFDGLIALENKARRKDLAEQFVRLSQALPALDVPRAVRSAFCRELSPSQNNACDEVFVLSDRPAAEVHRPTANLPRGSILVRLSIEYARVMRSNELRIIAALSDVSASGQLGQPLLYAWYVTPGTDATPASPLDSTAKEMTAKEKAARAYWFDGAPSRMETELLQSFSEIAQIIRLSMTRIADRSWTSLPTLADLQASGAVACKGASCKFRSLNLTQSRLWIVQSADAPVVMSVPRELWR
jgi:hypothetical protein